MNQTHQLTLLHLHWCINKVSKSFSMSSLSFIALSQSGPARVLGECLPAKRSCPVTESHRPTKRIRLDPSVCVPPEFQSSHSLTWLKCMQAYKIVGARRSARRPARRRRVPSRCLPASGLKRTCSATESPRPTKRIRLDPSVCVPPEFQSSHSLTWLKCMQAYKIVGARRSARRPARRRRVPSRCLPASGLKRTCSAAESPRPTKRIRLDSCVSVAPSASSEPSPDAFADPAQSYGLQAYVDNEGRSRKRSLRNLGKVVNYSS